MLSRFGAFPGMCLLFLTLFLCELYAVTGVRCLRSSCNLFWAYLFSDLCGSSGSGACSGLGFSTPLSFVVVVFLVDLVLAVS